MALKQLKDKTGGFVSEFREFIARGNVLDMAVGVIIGGAFGTISTSLVNDILMPLLSLLTGGLNFDDWAWTLRAAQMDGETVVQEAVVIRYGLFLSAVLNFFIVAFAVFLLVKFMNTAKRKAAELARIQKEQEDAAEAAAKAAEPSKEEVLLTEIRDLLKAQSGGKVQSGGGKQKGKK